MLSTDHMRSSQALHLQRTCHDGNRFPEALGRPEAFVCKQQCWCGIQAVAQMKAYPVLISLSLKTAFCFLPLLRYEGCVLFLRPSVVINAELFPQQAYDQKNIRRRVYDALNVLMAMNIISKEKKEIRWIGLPTNSAQECQNLEVK